MVNYNPRELVEGTLARAKMIKDHAYADSRGDLIPFVEVFRGGDPVATVFADQIDRDRALIVFMQAVSGFTADYGTLVVDAYFTQGNHSPAERSYDPNRPSLNPFTGRPFERGDLEREFRQNKTSPVSECLMVIGMRPNGMATQVSALYDADEKTGKLTWGEVVDADENTPDGPRGEFRATGVVPDNMRRGFEKSQDMFQLMKDLAKHFPDMTAEERRVHSDCAVTKMLMAEGFHTLLAVPREPHLFEIYERSLGEHMYRLNDDGTFEKAEGEDGG